METKKRKSKRRKRTPEEQAKRDRLNANSRRWYQRLKADPERYMEVMEKREEYERRHKKHIAAVRRKRDKRKYRAMKADPVEHEMWCARRRERYRQRMQDPAYREKMRRRAEANNAKKRARMAADPVFRAEENRKAALRRMARRDFLKSTPEGREQLRRQTRMAWQKIKADPERHERAKAKMREWIATCPEKSKAKRAANALKARKKVKAARKRRALRKKWYLANRDRLREAMRKWWANLSPEERRAKHRKSWLQQEQRYWTDPEAYQRRLETVRRYRMKKRKSSKPYKPRLSRRTPVGCTKGNVIDRRSVFIRNNMSTDALRAADAFHVEQCRENREWAEGYNEV